MKSPLILVPVTLVAGRRGGHYQLVLDESGASTPNFCLIEKLRQEEKLSIPGLENPVEDEHGIDLAATFAAVRTALAENGLDFHVDETADLAILQFAKFRLWKDLDESWEQLAAVPARPSHDRDPGNATTSTRPQTPSSATSTSSTPPARSRRTARSSRRSQPPSPARRSCSKGLRAPASRRRSRTCWPARSPAASGCCSSPRSARPSTW